MKVLSLIEPWASLMAVVAKRNETRSWSTTYRGDLAIAASNRKVIPILRKCDERMVEHCFFALRNGYALPDDPGVVWDHIDNNTIGRILCVVRVAQMVQTERVTVGHPESLFGDYTAGRWVWVTTDCRRLREPLPFRGSQGIRDLPSAIEEQIRKRLI